MNIFTEIAQAAENSMVVSCTGSDCGACSLLETVSNVYNFFLAVSFAVAVFVLVVAGASYLISGGNRSKLQKSLYLLKGGLAGFALIILGWLVIQSVIKVAGYSNAGNWWQFQCGLEGKSAAGEIPSQNEYQQSLRTFPDLAAFLKSGEKQAKLTGPIDVSAFSGQLKGLKNGEKLHFLAPARIGSAGGEENSYLPLFSVKKEGDGLSLDNVGEYWNLIQNQWGKTGDQSNLSSSNQATLDGLLGTDSWTDDRSPITSGGETIGSSSNSDPSSLYAALAQVLGTYSQGGDRSLTGSGQENISGSSLSDLIAMAANYEGSGEQNTTDQLISLLTVETLRLVSTVMVDKEEADSIFASSSWRCVESGGEWVNGSCSCSDQSVLGQDEVCHVSSDLEGNCTGSGGEWKKSDGELSPSPACGSQESAWSGIFNSISNDNSSERADISQVISDKNYCQCADATCLDAAGFCRNENRDDDGDKIANAEDRCPNTPTEEKNGVNKTTGSKYYGCGCSEIGMVQKECPASQCVGNNWAVYPSGKQDCRDGELLAYSCQPVESGYDENCAATEAYNSANRAAQSGGGSNSNNNTSFNNSSIWESSNNNSSYGAYNSNSNYIGGRSTSSSGGKGANQGGNKGNLGKGDTGKIADNWDKSGSGSGRTGMGDSNDWGQSYAGSEGVKKAFKRIYDRDKLRYLMLFKYTKFIRNQGGGGGMAGGLTWGCGQYSVTFGSGIRILDRIIMHEGTHSADFCNGTIGDIPGAEYVATGNEMGSVGRIKESPGQKEEVKVADAKLNAGRIGNDRLEVRGYGSRIINTDIDPQGDMNPSMLGADASYAKGYKSSSGNWTYGWVPGGEAYTLRLSDNEHNRVLRIVETIDQRNCMTRPPEDLPQLTEESGYKESQLKGCKPTDTGTPVIKLGN